MTVPPGPAAARETLPEATLCHVVDGDRTLLIRKQRGVGAGKLIGPGGKLEGDETPRECVVREVREELAIRVCDPAHAGAFAYWADDWSAVVHVFRASSYEGTPSETDEAVPVWVPVDDLPTAEMWATDREWLPAVLDGDRFRGTFVYHEGDPRYVEVETGVDPLTVGWQ